MFFIRADANPTIATGHIMRCLSIAGELKKRNIPTTFIIADDFSKDLIHSRGFETICLDSKWDYLEYELDLLKNLIIKNNISSLLIDSYYVTSHYVKELRKVTKVIYLDDLGIIDYPVDMLINYNIYGDTIDYSKLVGSSAKLVLGAKYAPLRDEFQNIKTSFKNEVNSVLISTGGTDTYNIAGQLLTEITKSNKYINIHFHVISGKMNKNLYKLLEIEANNNNISIHQNVVKMSEIMLKCDIAISACGSTMYELCRCGLPIITFSFADNQILGVKGFQDKGIAINCGDYREGNNLLISRILTGLETLIKNCNLREEMYIKETTHIDGKGVFRLVDEIS